jgi:hypothetical protein
MTTAHDIDLSAVLAERLTTAHPDVLRELLATFIPAFMGAEADAVCEAGYNERSTERSQARMPLVSGPYCSCTAPSADAGRLILTLNRPRHRRSCGTG